MFEPESRAFLLTFNEEGNKLELYNEPYTSLEFATQEDWERFKSKWEQFLELQKIAPLERLQELAQADREGRVVVLSAKTVFIPTWDAGPDCDLKCPVTCDESGCCEFCDKSIRVVYEEPCMPEHLALIGKTVFLSREEAEAALKWRETEGNTL